MAADFCCRLMEAGDLSAVAAIEAGEPGGWSDVLLVSELAQPSSYGMVLACDRKTAEDDSAGVCAGVAVRYCLEDVAGYLIARRVLDEMEILRFVIVSSCRRQGLGRLLLGHVLERAAGSGVAHCHLEVRAAGEAALRLYLGQGFVPCGLRRAYYSDPVDDALLLQKKLYEVSR